VIVPRRIRVKLIAFICLRCGNAANVTGGALVGRWLKKSVNSLVMNQLPRPQHKQAAEIYDFVARIDCLLFRIYFGRVIAGAVSFGPLILLLGWKWMLSLATAARHTDEQYIKRTTTLFGLTSGVDPLATRRLTFRTHLNRLRLVPTQLNCCHAL
jgi:hypothetical protein